MTNELNIELALMQSLWRAEAKERNLEGKAVDGYVQERQIEYYESKDTGRHLPGVRVVTPAPEPGILDTPESRASKRVS